ncbi:hypothetical protein V1514DRAFT_294312 [Lipomyces japonicus]|uniref:uncharacterized protein n=1 Tax=Lipomyces japonicus TaxID=56871 RepID=UPI0034CDF631
MSSSDIGVQYAEASQSPEPRTAHDDSLEKDIQARIRAVESQSLGIQSRAIGKPENGTSLLGNSSQTLYVNNLNDKIQKEEIRLCLYMLFETYGRVLDIVVLKTPKMRGQAHIAYSDAASATLALRSLQGITFLGKELRIAYSRSKSHAVAKLDGTYKLPLAGVTSTLAEESPIVNKGIKRTRDEDEDDKHD